MYDIKRANIFNKQYVTLKNNTIEDIIEWLEKELGRPVREGEDYTVDTWEKERRIYFTKEIDLPFMLISGGIKCDHCGCVIEYEYDCGGGAISRLESPSHETVGHIDYISEQILCHECHEKYWAEEERR